MRNRNIDQDQKDQEEQGQRVIVSFPDSGFASERGVRCMDDAFSDGLGLMPSSPPVIRRQVLRALATGPFANLMLRAHW
jgi:hypothetical protein